MRCTRKLVKKGVRIDTGPVDQTWGNREMYVKDAEWQQHPFYLPEWWLTIRCRLACSAVS